MINIPNEKELDLRYIVCDYNGTIAKDGVVIDGVKEVFKKLKKEYKIYVITADTFGSVKEMLKDFECEIKILTSQDHTKEKADFIKKLGRANSVAFGNGNNDSLMLNEAELGIAIIGSEGCSKDTLFASNLLSHDIINALELLLYPKRLIATLRR